MNTNLLKRMDFMTTHVEVKSYRTYIIRTTLCLLVLLCVNLCACSAAVDNMKNVYSCTYKVSFEFSNTADVSIMEERIKAFMFNIEDKQIEGNKMTYTLERYSPAEEGYFDLFCTNDGVSIENKNGKTLLSKSDVLSIKVEFGNAYVEVTDAKFAEFANGEWGACYFVLGEEKVFIAGMAADESLDNRVIKFIPRNSSTTKITTEEEKMFVKGIIGLISDPLGGVVSAEVIDEKVTMK